MKTPHRMPPDSLQDTPPVSGSKWTPDASERNVAGMVGD